MKDRRLARHHPARPVCLRLGLRRRRGGSRTRIKERPRKRRRAERWFARSADETREPAVLVFCRGYLPAVVGSGSASWGGDHGRRDNIETRLLSCAAYNLFVGHQSAARWPSLGMPKLPLIGCVRELVITAVVPAAAPTRAHHSTKPSPAHSCIPACALVRRRARSCRRRCCCKEYYSYFSPAAWLASGPVGD